MPKKSTWAKDHPTCAAATREAVDAVRAEKDREIERLKAGLDAIADEVDQSTRRWRMLTDARQADKDEIERFRGWAQQLLDVSEYVGTDREDASRWQCAFGCGGYSYENVNGVTTPDGGYQRTPPASHDWHAETCRVRKLAADLAKPNV